MVAHVALLVEYAVEQEALAAEYHVVSDAESAEPERYHAALCQEQEPPHVDVSEKYAASQDVLVHTSERKYVEQKHPHARGLQDM